jgi:hypothetical protein
MSRVTNVVSSALRRPTLYDGRGAGTPETVYHNQIRPNTHSQAYHACPPAAEGRHLSLSLHGRE